MSEEDAAASACAAAYGHGLAALPCHLLHAILARFLCINELFTVAATCTSLRKAAHDVLSDARMQAVSVARRPAQGHNLMRTIDVQEGQTPYNPCQAQGAPVFVSSSHLGHACLKSLLLHVPHLVLLDLRWAFNWVDDASLGMLGSWCPPTLRHLILQSCAKITHAGLQDLCGSPALRQLESLVLRGCGDVGDGASLAELPNLRHLDLSWCTSVTSAGLLPVCGWLSVATFRGCELLDSSLCSELKNAEVVDLSFTRVCNTGLRALACLPRLKRLQVAARTNNIYGTGLYTDSCLEEVIRARPSLVVDLVVA